MTHLDANLTSPSRVLDHHLGGAFRAFVRIRRTTKTSRFSARQLRSAAAQALNRAIHIDPAIGALHPGVLAFIWLRADQEAPETDATNVISNRPIAHRPPQNDMEKLGAGNSGAGHEKTEPRTGRASPWTGSDGRLIVTGTQIGASRDPSILLAGTLADSPANSRAWADCGAMK